MLFPLVLHVIQASWRQIIGAYITLRRFVITEWMEGPLEARIVRYNKYTTDYKRAIEGLLTVGSVYAPGILQLIATLMDIAASIQSQYIEKVVRRELRAPPMYKDDYIFMGLVAMIYLLTGVSWTDINQYVQSVAREDVTEYLRWLSKQCCSTG
jgi:hypothetical protein